MPPLPVHRVRGVVGAGNADVRLCEAGSSDE
jgi:hypothetical protein